MTNDHKASDLKEMKRIKEAGGTIVYKGNTQRIEGVLATSRALGDVSLKSKKGVISIHPDIHNFVLSPIHKAIVFATDGVWDVVSNQKARDIVLGVKNSDNAAEQLSQYALKHNSLDNISCTVVNLFWNVADKVAFVPE